MRSCERSPVRSRARPLLLLRPSLDNSHLTWFFGWMIRLLPFFLSHYLDQFFIQVQVPSPTRNNIHSPRWPAPTKPKLSSTQSTAPCRRSHQEKSPVMDISPNSLAHVCIYFLSDLSAHLECLLLIQHPTLSTATPPSRRLPQAPFLRHSLPLQSRQCALAEGDQRQRGDISAVCTFYPHTDILEKVHHIL